jgi:hypothetical protein
MKTRSRYGWAMLAASCLLAAGCIQTKEEVTIRADGSGTVKMEIESQVPAEALMGMGRMGNETPAYPPVSKAMVEKLFPGKDFTVKVQEQKREGSGMKLVVEAGFKDVNALLASPYGKAHALLVTRTGETLTFKALSGLQSVAGMLGNSESAEAMEALGGQFGGTEGVKKDLSYEFKVTLPQPISSANGTRTGATAAWSLSSATLTNMARAAAAFGQPMEAVCAATGVTFTPSGPVRLALGRFEDVPAGPLGGKASIPDPVKVAAAVRFVPCQLVTERTFSLSGERSYGGNQAILTGLVIVPRELAPSQFGAVKLTAAVDDKGRSLKPGEDDEEGRFSRSFAYGLSGTMGGDEEQDEEDAEAGGKKAVPAEVQRLVTLQFKSPERAAREITRLEATIDLNYYGVGRIVKLEKAIEAGQIMDQTKMRSYSYGGKQEPLASSALKEMGLVMVPQMCMKQMGMTMLMFQVKGQKAAVEEIQVYDAAGQPCATTFTMQMGGGEEGGMCQVMVSGPATPPLSLAVVAREVGSPVKVPIKLEHVPLTTPLPAKGKD